MLYRGDSAEILKTLEVDSVDALVTDPPAGISFMGKAWDDDKGGRDEWIKWMSEMMRECHRVMKPGAHGLVWSIPRTSHWTAFALEDAGFEVRDCITHLFGSGFPKSLNVAKAGATGWEGFGTALKPAAEFWWLVRKPLSEKTVAKNVLKYGTGALNIDGSRVPGKLDGDPNRFAKTDGGWAVAKFDTAPLVRSEGRFPANLVFSHTPYCTDEMCDIECAIKMLDGQSGMLKNGGGNEKCKKGGGFDRQSPIANPTKFAGDSGGASRFFYCAKISSSERGADNKHPTVKPKKLMGYLIKLVTPPGGIVLDPFMGSGSTGIAAKENGFEFIGIEREQEYFEIAKKRIEHAENRVP